MLEFQNPAAFLLFLLIPLLYLLRYLKIFKQITFSAVLADWNGKAFVWKGRVRRILSVLAKVIIFAGFVITIFAFADPVITRQEKVYTSLGSDIVFELILLHPWLQRILEECPALKQQKIQSARLL